MASSQYPLLFFLLISLSISSSTVSSLRPISERKVGGRSAVPDVESNHEVQELGRYCVEQYNRRFRGGGGSPLLSFSRVVAAERQVVSGIKYYLTLAARDQTAAGHTRMFDAVVVVKSWAEVTDLVSFTPSTGYWKYN